MQSAATRACTSLLLEFGTTTGTPDTTSSTHLSCCFEIFDGLLTPHC